MKHDGGLYSPRSLGNDTERPVELRAGVIEREPRSPRRSLLLPLFLSALVLAAIAAFARLQPIPVSHLTRDMAALGQLHPLAGALSTLGILMWSASAAVCLFAASALRGTRDRAASGYLFSAGFLSACLMLDDAFQFHEALAPQWLGLRERYVYAGLIMAVVGHLFAFRAVIRRTDWPLLLLALVLLGTSMILDTLLEALTRRAIGEWQFLLEDGTKWMGIACWGHYHMRSCRDFFACKAV